MRKYWFVFSLYWQEGLARRSSFIAERLRALVVLVSFYYFWKAVLAGQDSVAGYDAAAMLTYLLGMNVLRSLVFASQSWEVSMDINQGRLSTYLIRPINFMAYTFFRDLSEKSINLTSAIIEICGLVFIFKMNVRWPTEVSTWGLFILACLLGAIMYFVLSFMVACWGFWTAESGGPRWLMELFLEFSAGAFFPIDVLPARVQEVFMHLPSPYMVFFPLQVFLEKVDSHQIINGFLSQMFWIAIFLAATRVVWQKGLRYYGAEGS